MLGPGLMHLTTTEPHLRARPLLPSTVSVHLAQRAMVRLHHHLLCSVRPDPAELHWPGPLPSHSFGFGHRAALVENQRAG